MSKTHWRTFHETDYIGAYDLDDGNGGFKEITVTIVKAEKKKVKDRNGNESYELIAEIKDSKPMFVNVTNSKMIEKLYKTPYVEEWAGKTIVLCVEKGIKSRGGGTTDGIRVKNQLPKPTTLPELKEGHPRWAGAVDSITQGNTTIEAIKRNFTLSPENEQMLCDLIPKTSK